MSRNPDQPPPYLAARAIPTAGAPAVQTQRKTTTIVVAKPLVYLKFLSGNNQSEIITGCIPRTSIIIIIFYQDILTKVAKNTKEN